MKVVVLGGTGPSGLQVLKYCLKREHQVTAVVRSPEKIPEDIKSNENFKSVQVSIFDANALATHFEGQDGVLSCLGVAGFQRPFTTLDFYSTSVKSIVEAMKLAGIRRFIAMTSWATEYHPATSKFVEWFFKPLFIGRHLADMAVMEHYLEEVKGDVDFTAVRPARLTDGEVTTKQIKTQVGESGRMKMAVYVIGGDEELASGFRFYYFLIRGSNVLKNPILPSSYFCVRSRGLYASKLEALQAAEGYEKPEAIPFSRIRLADG